MLCTFSFFRSFVSFVMFGEVSSFVVVSLERERKKRREMIVRSQERFRPDGKMNKKMSIRIDEDWKEEAQDRDFPPK